MAASKHSIYNVFISYIYSTYIALKQNITSALPIPLTKLMNITNTIKFPLEMAFESYLGIGYFDMFLNVIEN